MSDAACVAGHGQCNEERRIEDSKSRKRKLSVQLDLRDKELTAAVSHLEDQLKECKKQKLAATRCLDTVRMLEEALETGVCEDTIYVFEKEFLDPAREVLSGSGLRLQPDLTRGVAMYYPWTRCAHLMQYDEERCFDRQGVCYRYGDEFIVFDKLGPQFKLVFPDTCFDVDPKKYVAELSEVYLFEIDVCAVTTPETWARILKEQPPPELPGSAGPLEPQPEPEAQEAADLAFKLDMRQVEKTTLMSHADWCAAERSGSIRWAEVEHIVETYIVPELCWSTFSAHDLFAAVGDKACAATANRPNVPDGDPALIAWAGSAFVQCMQSYCRPDTICCELVIKGQRFTVTDNQISKLVQDRMSHRQ